MSVTLLLRQMPGAPRGRLGTLRLTRSYRDTPAFFRQFPKAQSLLTTLTPGCVTFETSRVRLRSTGIGLSRLRTTCCSQTSYGIVTVIMRVQMGHRRGVQLEAVLRGRANNSDLILRPRTSSGRLEAWSSKTKSAAPIACHRLQLAFCRYRAYCRSQAPHLFSACVA